MLKSTSIIYKHTQTHYFYSYRSINDIKIDRYNDWFNLIKGVTLSLSLFISLSLFSNVSNQNYTISF